MIRYRSDKLSNRTRAVSSKTGRRSAIYHRKSSCKTTIQKISATFLRRMRKFVFNHHYLHYKIYEALVILHAQRNQGEKHQNYITPVNNAQQS